MADDATTGAVETKPTETGSYLSTLTGQLSDARRAAAALGAGGGGDTSYVPRTIKALRENQTAKDAATDPIVAKLQAGYDADTQNVEAKAAAIEPVDIKKWEQPPPTTPPAEGFAQFASIFAVAASAFTHTPAANAMNAMAAGINAKHAGDMEAYHENYKAWKDNTEMALQRHKIQSEELQQALEMLVKKPAAGHAMMQAVAAKYGDKAAELMTEAGLYHQVAQLDQSRANAASGMAMQMLQLTAQHDREVHADRERREQHAETQRHNMAMEGLSAGRGTNLGNSLALAKLNSWKSEFMQTNGREPNDDETYSQYNSIMQEAKVGRAAPTATGLLSQQAVIQADAEIKGLKGQGHDLSPAEEAAIKTKWITKSLLDKSPFMHGLNALEAHAVTMAAEKDPTLMDDPTKLGQVVREVAGRNSPTPKQVEDIENKGREYAHALDAMDRLRTNMQKAFTVGLGGKIARPIEAIGNIAGFLNDTDRADFLSDLDYLQRIAPELLSYKGTAGSAGRVGDERLEKIIRGKSLGDTAQNVASSLDRVGEIFAEDLMGLNEQYGRFRKGESLPALRQRGITPGHQATSSPATSSPATVPLFSSPDDPGYKALPSGASYRDAQGNTRQKK